MKTKKTIFCVIIIFAILSIKNFCFGVNYGENHNPENCNFCKNAIAKIQQQKPGIRVSEDSKIKWLYDKTIINIKVIKITRDNKEDTCAGLSGTNYLYSETTGLLKVDSQGKSGKIDIIEPGITSIPGNNSDGKIGILTTGKGGKKDSNTGVETGTGDVLIFTLTDEQYIVGNSVKGWRLIITGKHIIIDYTEEEKKTISDMENAKKTLSDMENAWKTVPNKNATAEQILRFYNSDVSYNEGNNMKKVDKETLKAWEKTIDNAKIGTLERELYNNVSNAINNLLTTGTIGEKVAEETKKAAEAAEKATKSTMKGYLGKLTQSTGEDRVGEFSTDVTTNPTGYKPADELTGSNKTKTETIIGTILKVVSNIGIVASVLIIAILGLKYMIGSVEEKADYKQDLIPYFVGATLLFGITIFVKILMALGNNINNS